MNAMSSAPLDRIDRPVFLGIDGGGTKTSFLMLDGDGRLLARHVSGSSYYLEIGFDALGALLRDGVAETLKQRAYKIADRQLSAVEQTMRLEDQEVTDGKRRQIAIQQQIEKLLQRPARLWDEL